jgi:hypothetical protein
MNVFKIPSSFNLKDSQRGQSLVEMAFITPILLLMLIGVFEVGWALRGYLVLSNMNRESARYAVKPGVLDFQCKPPKALNPATGQCETVISSTAQIVGYDRVLAQTIASLGVPSQVPISVTNSISANATIIMSYIVVDTQFPCVEYQSGRPRLVNGKYVFDSANCNCDTGDARGDIDGDGTVWFGKDDLVAHPGMTNYPHFAQTFGLSRTTRIGNGNYAAEAARLALENNQLNCMILKTGTAGEITDNVVFISELFYNQPQLLGVPFISNRLTDPIPLYAHTAMRLIASRDAESTDVVGPVCEAMPLVFKESVLPAVNASFEAYQSSGDFYWVTWNPNSSFNTSSYLAEELANRRLSMTDYTHATNAGDKTLTIGDQVSGVGAGFDFSSGNMSVADTLLKSYENRVVLVPVSTSNAEPYSVTHFAKIKINQVCLAGQCPGVTGTNRLIRATFLGYSDDSCQ